MNRQQSLPIANIGNAKFPLTYLLTIKRGVSWSQRRIELDRENFRYFKIDDNELRFEQKIDDCLLIESYPENAKKYFITLESKSK